MRICIITNGYPINAGDYWASFAYSFAHKIRKFGHEVYIFTPNRREKKDNYADVPVYWFPWLGGAKPLSKHRILNPFDLIKIISLIRNGNREIIKFAQEKKIDFCLAMWATPSGAFAYAAKKKLGTPYAVWCLGADIWTYSKYPVIKSITKKILKKADFIMADGFQLQQDVEQLSNEQCIFLPTSRVLPAAETNKNIVNQTKKNFLFIGRLEKVKGIDILIESVNLLLRENKNLNFNLYIFGVGSMEKQIKEKIKEYNLQKNVFFMGFASSQTAATYLNQCDWLVIPSRMESIPVVMSDALQMNTPVIASDVGDMGHLIRNYNIGKVIRSGDVADLTEKLKETMQINDATYDSYKNNTSILAREFNLNHTVKKFLDMAKIEYEKF